MQAPCHVNKAPDLTLQVEWNVPADPTKGHKYIWLSDEDYQAITKRSPSPVLKADSLTTKQGKHPPAVCTACACHLWISMMLSHAPVMNADKANLALQEYVQRTDTFFVQTGEQRWVVTDIVGAEDGLGVECLSGSGAIASVYARAFREGFTITLVSGRTVGIGAYLARLGRRCIQRADQPVILTGFSALNKLLGREVYTSQLQLGGPKVSLARACSCTNAALLGSGVLLPSKLTSHKLLFA